MDDKLFLRGEGRLAEMAFDLLVAGGGEAQELHNTPALRQSPINPRGLELRVTTRGEIGNKG